MEQVIFADAPEIFARTVDTAAFVPGEAHIVITEEPDSEIIDIFAPMHMDHHLENHQKPKKINRIIT